MVVRIPGLDEPALFGPPVASEATLLDELPAETRAEMERLQAVEDSVFIACSLADLTSRQRETALAAEEQAFGALNDPDAALGHVDGFAARLDDGFAAHVEQVVQQTGQRAGFKPSPEGLDLFRRRAEGVRRGALARNVMLEDGLRQRTQRRMIARAIDGLTNTVAREPDVLDEALGRLGDLAGSSRALIGDELAERLEQDSRHDLATAAARGLVDQDAETGAEALRSGAFDTHLDEVTRKRLTKEAEELSIARAEDEALRQQQDDARIASLKESIALDFMTGFRKRLETDEAGLEEIVTAQRDGTLSPARAEALRQELKDHREGQIEEDEKLRKITGNLDVGALLDPQVPDHRDLAEVFFQSVVGPGLESLKPREQIDLLESLPARLGIMPEGAMCPLGGMVLAGEPADRIAAAEAVTNVIARHPHAGDCLPPVVPDLAGLLTQFARLDLPPEKATELAEESFRNAIHVDDPDNPPRLVHPIGTDKPPEIRPLSTETGGGGDGAGSGGAADATASHTAVASDDDPAGTNDGGNSRHEAEEAGESGLAGEGGVNTGEGEVPEPDTDLLFDALLSLSENEAFAVDVLQRPARAPTSGEQTGLVGPGGEGELDQVSLSPETRALLAVLPGTGELLTAGEAGKELAAARDALDRGDDAAARAHLGMALVTGGGIMAGPIGRAVGKAFKGFKTGALRLARPGIDSQAFAKWIADHAAAIAAGKAIKQGELARVGLLSRDTVKFLRGKGIDPQSISITIRDDKLNKLIRDSGRKTGKEVPREMVEKMPEILQKPNAVLWDRNKRNLLYVFDVPNDPRKGKFVVNVDFDFAGRRGGKRVKVTENSVVSGGMLSSHNLRQKDVFEPISGRIK